ncbi:hypothetical protein [Gelidibacter maritimus]|uniref:Uncharacterized protein n=1 Tax=Gelidibacter maritimus TaxID=2761487 RepID=A0A7W2R4K0_9FLAO|nr:hypothetical protein [Gelidibacter maritimus]MBA6153942.1 hypothetical protein [Gelidibacter maritimus]
MVTIVDYKTYQREEDGSDFHVLIVQGGLEAVKSRQTNNTYLTARTARVSCTFNEATCKSLIGSQLPGAIKKVAVAPYEYAIPETGEIVSLSHNYCFVSEEEAVIQDHYVISEEVN